jgi:hypothetical protein
VPNKTLRRNIMPIVTQKVRMGAPAHTSGITAFHTSITSQPSRHERPKEIERERRRVRIIANIF